MTLVEARRLARTRRIVGGLIVALAVIGLLFALLKHLYPTLPSGHI
jgi:hypothetical protein